MKMKRMSKKTIILAWVLFSILIIAAISFIYLSLSNAQCANAKINTVYNFSIHTDWQDQAANADPIKYNNWPKGTEENSLPKENKITYTFNQMQDDETVSFAHMFLTTEANTGNKVEKNKHIRGAEISGKTVTFKPSTLSINTSYTGFIQVSTNKGNVFNSEKFIVNTKDVAPGNIAVQGITNFRDMGGWKSSINNETTTIKQGIIYRSSAMDINGNITIEDEGKTEMKDDLGFKTEIDLRVQDNPKVDHPFHQKILGSSVEYHNIPINYVDNKLTDFLDNQPIRDAIKQEFDLFADNTKYPIFFHCNIGTDRTGLTAYLLNGLLGVSENNLYTDYMFSNFGHIFNSRSVTTPQTYTDLLNKRYPEKANLQQRIETYLTEQCNITHEQIANIKANMLEETNTSLNANVTTRAAEGKIIPHEQQNWTLELFAGSNTDTKALDTKEITTIDETTSEKVSFDNIKITHAGTFLYTIKQTKINKWKPDIQTKPVYLKVDVVNGEFIINGPYTDQTCEVLYKDNTINFVDTFIDEDESNIVKIRTEMQDAAIQNVDHNGAVISEMSHNGYHGFIDRSKPLDYNISYDFSEMGITSLKIAKLELTEGNGFYTPNPKTKIFEAHIAGNKAVATLNTLGVDKTYTYKFVATTEDGTISYSPNVVFQTESGAPANKNVDTVTNVRDIGGRETTNGYMVKQGMIYRTARIDAADKIGESARNTLLKDFGLKTELDLRGTPKKSALGDDIEFHCFDMEAGKGNFITSPEKCKAIAEQFKLFSDKTKFPLFFHCSIGTDRTGIIAFLLNGLLGVPPFELYKDYIFSNMGRIQYERVAYEITWDMKILNDEYKKDNVQNNVIAYLTDQRKGKPNLSQETVNNILDNMLEPHYSNSTISFKINTQTSPKGTIPKEEQKFVFELFDSNVQSSIDKLEVTTSESQKIDPVSFHERTFTEVGVYPFNIKQTFNDDWTSDLDNKTFFMKSEDNNGKLKVTGPYEDSECTKLYENGIIPCNITYKNDAPDNPTNNSSSWAAQTADANSDLVTFIIVLILCTSFTSVIALKKYNIRFK